MNSRSAGEEFLHERGVVKRPSPVMEAVLGCLACRWSQGLDAYTNQLVTCTGKGSGSVTRKLTQLHRAGLVTRRAENGGESTVGRPLRILYEPADTPDGKALAELIQPPDHCRLSEATPADPEQAIGSNHIITDRLRQEIDSLSSPALLQVIRLAAQRLSRPDLS